MPCDSGYGDPQREFEDRYREMQSRPQYHGDSVGGGGYSSHSRTYTPSTDGPLEKSKKKGPFVEGAPKPAAIIEQPSLQTELDHVTALLCDVCDVLDSCGINYSTELTAWKQKHDEIDYAKQKHDETINSRKGLSAVAERLKKQLTPAEKKALKTFGID